MTQYALNGATNTFTYDEDDKLLSDNEFTYEYDNAGRLKHKKKNDSVVEEHKYNWNNRTTNIMTVSGNVTNRYCYRFDVTGRRVYKKEAGDEAAVMQYDLFDIYKEYNDRTCYENTRHVFALAIDSPIELKRSNSLYYYHTDHLDSVIGLSSNDQTIVASFKYYAYGKVQFEVKKIFQPYTYTAREHVGNTGLLYYRTRLYSTINKRFLREDDIFKQLSTQNIKNATTF
ncbi:MAG: hypothetical protein A2096_03375 [Spirochaetes bacterium GWF1_41_5]|nr:MAG: hypothetical protein A2096_03375 [Spirochaetes bacterium GWF1_41_5]